MVRYCIKSVCLKMGDEVMGRWGYSKILILDLIFSNQIFECRSFVSTFLKLQLRHSSHLDSVLVKKPNYWNSLMQMLNIRFRFSGVVLIAITHDSDI